MLEMVGHRSAVHAKFPSEVIQRAAVLVLGGYGCNFRRVQSTLDRFRWASRNDPCSR
jgi:hypothetical protein